ncbi:MAG: purine-nucleoside phosphorylase [Lentisphaerota bacterium]
MSNSQLIDIKVLEQAWEDVKKHFPKAKPFGAFILGSGWGDAVKVFKTKSEVSYDKITGMGAAGVVGHAGVLSLVEYNGKEFFVFQGRRHFYEGEGWTPVVIPAYIAKQSGAKIFFVSNACGGVTHKPGDLMMITDHINYMGSNPLMGPNYPELGTRFPDMSEVYNKELIKLMEKAGKKAGVDLVKGVYMAYWGPIYETPAEVRMSKIVGADAVGMSTVPEATLANSMGLKVAGLSCITNYAAGITDKPLNHKEVIETLNSVMGNIHKLLPEIVKAFSEVK